MKLTQEVLNLFRKNNAVLHGHFLLASGLHTDQYFQCAKIFEKNFNDSEYLCKKLFEKLINKIDLPDGATFVGPAMGGIILSYEMARRLNSPLWKCCFVEKTKDGFVLRRGFKLRPDSEVIVTEDVITTGNSAAKVINMLKEQHQVKVIAVISLINRSGQVKKINKVPFIPLISVKVNTYSSNNLPDYLKHVPVEKPGSR